MLGEKNSELLKAFFEQNEWEYLQSLQKFTALMSGSKDTVDDVVELSSIGERLLQERGELQK
jgi:hypothetical protein